MSKILDILSFLMDQIPGRRERIDNEIQDIKDKLHEMQQKKSVWTDIDTITYYKYTDRLSYLEKRSRNARK